ncbi:RAD51-associated protein 1 [Labrus bergylta]|uniref:RAD51 associated protein 1 n=1 Tax=Labrus bergylta TaxID=56723 RepID=A0A3Q3F3P5_9LABR|nr:RAD51-associated protein 1 [Labrus bergylta]
MDRPARKSKVVNYCEAKDFDDDEDFACAKAPPSKKAREDVKMEHRRSLSKSSSQESNFQTSVIQKSRRPLDERLQERDLEAAITLSMLNSADEKKDQPLPTKGDAKLHVPADENTDPTSLHISNCSVDIAVLGLDEITPVRGSLPPSRQKKAADKDQWKKPAEEDEDYKPKLTPDSESDEDFSEPAESDDEEFTVKKVSKTKKTEKVTKTTQPQTVSKKEKQPPKSTKPKPQAAAASPPVRSPPTEKLAPKRPAPTPVVPKSKPAVSVSPAGGRVPKWTPPGQVGRSLNSSLSPAGRSPGQGLRLGLSRRVRVKPLHPSVTSH